MKIRGSKVLLTGASGGLGEAIADGLAGLGAELILSARNEEKLNEIAARTGGVVEIADLTKRKDVDRLCAVAREVDIVIANAGIGGESTIDTMTKKEVDQSLDVNLRAPILLSAAFAHARAEKNKPGHLVMIGSLAGMAATPNTRMYNATKFGLRGYTLSLRQDLDELGIGVTHVAPGFISEAGMFHNNGVELPPGVRSKTPKDVAEAVAKGIEQNKGEVFVAPTELRVLSTFSTVAPAASAAIQRRLGVAERKKGLDS